MALLTSAAHAQTRWDSVEVLKTALLYYAERSEGARVGVAAQSFTPNRIVNGRGTGFRWNSTPRSSAAGAAIAANAKLRAAPAFDSIPRTCHQSGGANDGRQVCVFRDYDAVVSTSEPVLSGQSATLYVRQDIDVTTTSRIASFLTVWLYELELRSGRWVVVNSRIVEQS